MRMNSETRAEKKARRQRGTSLVEFVLAAAAAVMLLSSVIQVILQTANLRRVDDEIHLAFTAAQNNLEELRNIPFAQLPAIDGQGFDVKAINGAPGGLRPVPGDPDGLTGLLSVTIDQTGGGETLYIVRATVQWAGIRGNQQLLLESLMAERSDE